MDGIFGMERHSFTFSFLAVHFIFIPVTHVHALLCSEVSVNLS